MLLENFDYKNHNIEIHTDDSPMSPREDDNLSQIHAWHKRVNLGDEGYNYNLDFQTEHDRLEDNLKQARKNNDIVYPLYIYQHSGIALSLDNSHYPFTDKWDAGQVGYVIVSREKVLKEFSRERLTKKLRNKVRRIIEAEIETYNQYLNGEIYGYKIKDNQDNLIDSLWNIYEQDNAEEEAKEYVNNIDEPNLEQRFIDYLDERGEGYGEWLKENDPIGFQVGLSEFDREGL
ncbi:MAG: hypothetical protein ACOCRX_01485 [Candidatus Woesearchaeota archaeon]